MIDHGPPTSFERFELYRNLGWFALAVVMAFASGVPGEFVWVETPEIEEGGYLVHSIEDLRSMLTMTMERYIARGSGMPHTGTYWRPVYGLSISLDAWLWGDRPWCYQVENLVWHLAVVAGLYFLGRRVFVGLKAGDRIAFWAALLFAVHPLGVESVTWICGRSNLLCAAFGLGALLAFARAADGGGRPGASWQQSASWLVLSATCMLLAAGSKELGLLVPLAALLLARPNTESLESPDRQRLRLARLGGLGALWGCAGALLIYRLTVLNTTMVRGSYPAETLWGNVATSATIWWHYVGRVLFPFEPMISDVWPVSRILGLREVAAILGIIVAAGILAYGYRRRWPVVIPLLWYVIWTIPSLGIAPLRHFRTERYLYPASWGLLAAFLVVWLAGRHAPSASERRRSSLVLASVAVAFTLATAYANTFWRTNATLFGHSVQQDPRHVEGRFYLAQIAMQKGDAREAVRQYTIALNDAENPGYVAYCPRFIGYSNLGISLTQIGRMPEAKQAFQQAYELAPRNPTAAANLARAHYSLGDLETARRYFEEALKLDPAHLAARRGLGLTFQDLDMPRRCAEVLRPVVRNHPEDIICLQMLAASLLKLGEFAEAEGIIQALVQKRPDDAGAIARLAWCQWRVGKREQARQNLARARRLAPHLPIVQQVGQLMSTP